MAYWHILWTKDLAVIGLEPMLMVLMILPVLSLYLIQFFNLIGHNTLVPPDKTS